MSTQTSTQANRQGLWRYSDGAIPNLIVTTYIIAAPLLAISFLASSSLLLMLIAIVLFAHSQILAAYMIHELAHALVFRQRRHNALLGELFSWLCGTAYARFERIRRMHLRHHTDRADIACFDHQDFLRSCPNGLQKGIYALEWLHIPAVELIMHYQVLVRPFRESALASERPRVLVVGISRWVFFLILLSISPWALLCYGIGYLIFIKALFLGDAFAHTYPAYVVENAADPVPADGRNAAFDRLNTFSNLLSMHHPWLNLWNLNFGYHNAHHDKVATPWYRLPAVQKELYGEGDRQYLPYGELWNTFHRNRLNCIMSDDIGQITEGKGRADQFVGVHGVSFLSIV